MNNIRPSCACQFAKIIRLLAAAPHPASAARPIPRTRIAECSVSSLLRNRLLRFQAFQCFDRVNSFHGHNRSAYARGSSGS